MKTNKEKSKCWCICPGNFGSAHCNCPCHKSLEPQVDNQQEIRDEFIKWHTSETTFALGTPDDRTISDWWLNKLSQAIEQERERVLAMVLKEIEVVETHWDANNPEHTLIRKGFYQALTTLKQKLLQANPREEI